MSGLQNCCLEALLCLVRDSTTKVTLETQLKELLKSEQRNHYALTVST